MPMTPILTRILSTFLIVATTLVCGAAPTRAAQPRAVGATPPRIAFIDGEVSFWRTGAEDWAPAHINTALAAGDSLYVADGANVEVEIASRAYVRAGSGTEIGIESLETGFLQLEVRSGHVALDLKRFPEGQVIEVDTPNGAFTIERSGYYRADVDDARATFSVGRGGFATVVAAGGESADVGDGDQLVLEGEETASIARNRALGPDDWDRWNFDRTAQLGERPRSAEYVPPAVAGIDDLDRYGDWRETQSYGHVWVPRAIGADWSPYSTGRWVWDPYYGWTWVDDAPWGWAPYHYGRWVYADSYWGWCPGPVVAAPVYSPALVAFFGSHGGVSVGVSIGGPIVSWVPLGYGEPVIPWWGPRGFVGRPYWGGWGGRRYVNNTVINNTTIVNVNNINTFQNTRVRNAIVGVDRGRFGRGSVEHVRLADARGLEVVRGEVGVKPVRESLVPRAERGRRPPDQVQNRRVVTRRAPQDDTTRRLREAGIEPQGRGRNVERRVVTPRPGGGQNERAERVRRGADTPPPVPGVERGDTRERGRGRDRDTGAVDRATRERGTTGDRGDVREPGRRDRRDANVDDRREAPSPPTVPGAENVRERDRRGRERGETQGIDRGDRGRERTERGRDVSAPEPPGGERRDRGHSAIERGNAVPPPTDRGRGGNIDRENRSNVERGGGNVDRGRGREQRNLERDRESGPRVEPGGRQPDRAPAREERGQRTAPSIERGPAGDGGASDRGHRASPPRASEPRPNDGGGRERASRSRPQEAPAPEPRRMQPQREQPQRERVQQAPPEPRRQERQQRVERPPNTDRGGHRQERQAAPPPAPSGPPAVQAPSGRGDGGQSRGGGSGGQDRGGKGHRHGE